MQRFAISELPRTLELTDRRRMRYCITFRRHLNKRNLSASWWNLPRKGMPQS